MLLTQFPIFYIFNKHLIDYPTSSNLNYFWGFGSLAGICLTLQLLTGIFLAMHYTAHVSLAFNSIEHIMRDVNNGWLIRYIHSNGASMFFLVVYTHIGRGLYFGSYWTNTAGVWLSGIIIFVLMMATAFMGYVLPWGQMSFWGATVITNLFTAIPVVGTIVAQTLWGGFSIDNPTLNRFFSLHYLLPFLIVGVVLLHLVLLHLAGSNNPLGISQIPDNKSFYPYFYTKDLFGLFIFFFMFLIFVGFYPNLLGHSDNYICANSMITPTHIVPEWYFLPFYAILRSIPDKLGGVALMGLAIAILGFLPFLKKPVIKSLRFRPFTKFFFWLFIVNVFLLVWLGACPVEFPYVAVSQLSTAYYFLWFIVINPLVNYIEIFLIKAVV